MEFDERQKKIKEMAEAKSGQTISFVEGGGDKAVKHGRIVGYYWALTQLVVAVKFVPKYPIDINARSVSVLSPILSTDTNFAMVGWDELAEGATNDNKIPHACLRCGSPALILYRSVECSNAACPCYRKP